MADEIRFTDSTTDISDGQERKEEKLGERPGTLLTHIPLTKRKSLRT